MHEGRADIEGEEADGEIGDDDASAGRQSEALHEAALKNLRIGGEKAIAVSGVDAGYGWH